MARTSVESGEDDERVHDRALSSILLSFLAGLFAFISFVLTGVYMDGTNRILGRVHPKGAVNSERLQFAKMGWDGAIMVLPIIIAATILTKRGHVSPSVPNMLVHFLMATAEIVVGALTLGAYVQEGYGGLVGQLPPKIEARRGGNSYHGPPAPRQYLSDLAKRDRMVRIWIASASLELLAGVCLVGVVVRLMVARWRNRDLSR